MVFSSGLIALAFAAGCAQSPSVDEAPPQQAPTSAPKPGGGLNEDSLETLADEPEVIAELELVLDEHFGNHNEPQYLMLPEWEASGFDPNGSPFDGKRPHGGFEAEDLERLREGNRKYWSDVLALVDEGDRNLPGRWRARRDLNMAWSELRAQRDELGEEAFAARVEEMFVDDYPTQADNARLFRRYCRGCHGPRGAGDGPLSTRMEPRPRDYRHGVFKFTAVSAQARPRRDDLRRTIEHGLPGTRMAAWERFLNPVVRDALIDRVRWVAIRGEVERWMVASWVASDDMPSESIEEAYREVWNRWLTADDHFVAIQDPVPPATPDSIARGKALFHDSAGADCASCHGANGRGDGPKAVEWAPDGTRRSLLTDEWGRPAWPRDLTRGIFRGGSRPVDLYRRVHCGVHGTPMPSQADTLTPEQIWDVVHYVRSIANLE